MKKLILIVLLTACSDDATILEPDAGAPAVCPVEKCGPKPERYVGDPANAQTWINGAEKWMECVDYYERKLVWVTP